MGTAIFVILSTILTICIYRTEAKMDLPDGISEEAYCVACERMASEVFRRLSGPDLKKRTDRVNDILKTLCSTGHFDGVIEYPPRDMVSACKHIMKGHKNQIKSSIDSVLGSTGSLLELKQGMCHISSAACRNVRKPVNFDAKINTVTDEDSLAAIEAYIKAHDGEVKMAGHPSRDEL